jgi:hypothetical protein
MGLDANSSTNCRRSRVVVQCSASTGLAARARQSPHKQWLAPLRTIGDKPEPISICFEAVAAICGTSAVLNTKLLTDPS